VLCQFGLAASGVNDEKNEEEDWVDVLRNSCRTYG
jgi:hypothetical protein